MSNQHPRNQSHGAHHAVCLYSFTWKQLSSWNTAITLFSPGPKFGSTCTSLDPFVTHCTIFFSCSAIKGRNVSIRYSTTSGLSWLSIYMPFFNVVRCHPNLISHRLAVRSESHFTSTYPSAGRIRALRVWWNRLGVTSPIGKANRWVFAAVCICSLFSKDCPLSLPRCSSGSCSNSW